MLLHGWPPEILRIDDGLFTITLRRHRNNHGQATGSLRFVDGATDMPRCFASVHESNRLPINGLHWRHTEVCSFCFCCLENVKKETY